MQDTRAEAALTIEELAHLSGMTVRNIRAHQTRGLLPPPALRGRTGYYGRDHVARLRLIKEMQSNGFGLKAIRTLLEAMPAGTGEEVLRFEQALLAPWMSEEQEIISATELARRFPETGGAAIRRSIALGVIQPLDDERYVVPQPTLLRAAEDLREVGIPVEKLLDVLDRVSGHSEAVAKVFVDLFFENVWRPFSETDRDAEQWRRMRESLERLRPLASRVLQTVFASAMSATVETTAEHELDPSHVKAGRDTA